MKWFGKSWGAPVCTLSEQVATPVGTSCLGCGEPIQADDIGFLIPCMRVEGVTIESSHHRCFMRSLGLRQDSLLEKKAQVGVLRRRLRKFLAGGFVALFGGCSIFLAWHLIASDCTLASGCPLETGAALLLMLLGLWLCHSDLRTLRSAD